MLAQINAVAKKTYTPQAMLVYIWGRDFVTIKVQIQTDAAAKGPEIDLNDDGNISAEMIQGRPFAPNDLFCIRNDQGMKRHAMCSVRSI